MKRIITTCPRDCYDTCSQRVTLGDDGAPVAISGNPDHPITRGFLCRRGQNDLKRRLVNRVAYPYLLNPDGSRRQERWDTALDHVATVLRQVLERWGPEKILLLDYAGNMGLLAGCFSRRLWHALGATFTDGSICSASGHAGIGLHYGLSYGLQPETLTDAALIVFWGHNAVVSAPHLWALAAGARKRRGAMIVAIDPRYSETAERADLWLRPRPGSDVALSYGLIRHMIINDAVDSAFIAERTTGYETLRSTAMGWSPERVADTSGVAPETLAALSDAVMEKTPMAVMIGIGIQKAVGGADAARAAALLPAVAGQPRGFFYGNKTAYPVFTDTLSGSRMAGGRTRRVSQVNLGRYLARGDFKFVYIMNMNPALTLPDQTPVRRGLQRDDVFVVVHDTHWTATAEMADVVLPASSYLEKTDVVIPWSHRYAGYAPAIAAPVAESRSEVDVMTALAGRLGLSQPWLFEDPRQAVETILDEALEGSTFSDLCRRGWAPLKCREAGHFQTPTGRITFSAGDGQAVMLPEPPPDQRRNRRYMLLSSSHPDYTHTQFQEIFGDKPAVVWIHPEDAARCRVDEGRSVDLVNEGGRVTVRAHITDRVPPGTLWSPSQCTGINGIAQNVLTSGKPQALGGGSTFNSTRVDIEV